MADTSLDFTAHRRDVFRYVSRVVGRADAANDLTQEVFLRLSRTPWPVGTDGERRAWMFKVARNVALNYLRDAARRPALVEMADAARPATQELAAALDQALAALAELDRDVFLMREEAGLSYGEIAAACELTSDAVRARLHRARAQLREALAGPIADQRGRGVMLARGRSEDCHD